MTFTVLWGQKAEQELADVWLSASDRESIVVGANEIDRLLESQPLSVGESRESSVSRVGIIPPLGVSFEVVVDDVKVFVTGVWFV